MTKKDYILIAQAIKNTAEENTKISQEVAEHPDDVLYRTSSELARKLKSDNPKFDQQRFMDACGFGDRFSFNNQ